MKRIIVYFLIFLNVLIEYHSIEKPDKKVTEDEVEDLDLEGIFDKSDMRFG